MQPWAKEIMAEFQSGIFFYEQRLSTICREMWPTEDKRGLRVLRAEYKCERCRKGPQTSARAGERRAAAARSTTINNDRASTVPLFGEGNDMIPVQVKRNHSNLVFHAAARPSITFFLPFFRRCPSSCLV